MQTELFVDDLTIENECIPFEHSSIQSTKTGYKYIDYQYTHSDGLVFEIAGPSVEWCRDKKNQWLIATEQEMV